MDEVLERLLAEGLSGEELLERYLTKDERDAISLDDFAWPSARKFPCDTQSHVDACAKLLGHAPENLQAEIKARAKRIAKRHGFTLPQSWQDEDDGKGKGDRAMEPELVATHMYLPITRIDPEKWLIEGQATSDQLDDYESIFDYDSSKNAFQRWRGNIREMHQNEAVGHAIEVIPNDETRSITLRAFISRGAKDTWEKIKDGTLSGFSVGVPKGQYRTEMMERNGKSIPVYHINKLAEVSVVDNPGSPGCDIAIVRADGMITDVLDDSEPEISGVTTPEPQTETLRSGTALSKANRDKLHAVRDNALAMCADNGCDECKGMMAGNSGSDDGDGDEDSETRLIEAVIMRTLAPMIQRVNALSARLAEQKPVEIPTPQQPVVNVDMTAIERRLEAIEGATNTSEVSELTRALDAKVNEVKEIVQRIANQPTGGGPYTNGAAMDKVLATQGTPNNNYNDLAVLARMAQSSDLTEEQRLRLAATQIKLQQGW